MLFVFVMSDIKNHVLAGKPKVADAMKSLCLMLGPDFITDIIEVNSICFCQVMIFNSSKDFNKISKSLQDNLQFFEIQMKDILKSCVYYSIDYYFTMIKVYWTCFQVETSDHARLRLKVAFNNHFEVRYFETYIGISNIAMQVESRKLCKW